MRDGMMISGSGCGFEDYHHDEDNEEEEDDDIKDKSEGVNDEEAGARHPTHWL